MSKGDLLLLTAGTKYKIISPLDRVTFLVLNFDYTSEHAHISNPIPPKTPETIRHGDVIGEVRFADVDELSSPVHFKKNLDVADKLTEI